MNLSALLSELEFCALDLETTGGNALFNRIVEIGIIKFNLNGTIDTYHTLVNPQQIIPDDVISIHGITNDMVKDSPTIDEILPAVINFIDNKILVIQNPSFDLAFLEEAMSRAKLPVPEWSSFDTVRMARYAFPDYPNHKLGTLCRMLGIDLNYHRALSDANGCLEVFKRIIKMKDENNTWTLQNLITYHNNLISLPLRKKTTAKTSLEKLIKFGEEITIEYIDSDNNLTKRTIIPEAFIKLGRMRYLQAFCKLRNEERYFKLTNIIKITESETTPSLF